MPKSLALVLGLVLSVTPGFRSQIGTGTITVLVLEQGTELPLAGVGVWVHTAGANTRETTTGPDGTATFGDLQPAQYGVQAGIRTHLTYSVKLPRGFSAPPPGPYDDKRDVVVFQPGRALVRLAPGIARPVTFRLPRGAVIAGVVTASGRPVAGARVSLLQDVDYVVGPHTAVSRYDSAVTGPSGAFEFVGLRGGPYRLAANPEAEGTAFNDVYYPGTSEIEDSEVVNVENGSRQDLELRIRRIPTVSLAGRVDDAGTSGRRLLTMRQIDVDTGHVISPQYQLDLRRDRTFGVDGVESAVHGLSYSIVSNTDTLVAAAYKVLHVGIKDISGIELRAHKVSSMSGRFVAIDGSSLPTADLHVVDDAVGEDASLRALIHTVRDVQRDGTFSGTPLIGRYRFSVRTPEGWLPVAMHLEDGQDILNKELDLEPGRHYANVRIVLTRDVARLEGTLSMAGLERVYGGVMIAVFPTDESLWPAREMLKWAYVDGSGRFAILNVHPWREYFVASCVWPCETRTPGKLGDLARTATRISVGRPATYTIALKR